MNLRLACNWLRGELVERAVHRLTVGPEQSAKEADRYEAAVAEVEKFLDPAPVTDDELDVDLEAWVAAGGEVAGVTSSN